MSYLIPQLIQQKGKRVLSCLTAYDVFTASLLSQSSVDMILVGDSLAHVVQGKNSTISVTLEQMIYHAQIVVAHAKNKLVIVDMPFGSFGITTHDTVINATRLFKESGAGAIKLEGASSSNLDAIQQLNAIGVPVMGHIGLQPQSVHVYGGYKIAGKTEDHEQRLLEEARALSAAGAFALVLECVVSEVSQRITQAIPILTIGIGAGPYVDGQVLVLPDLLGMTTGKAPKFVRRYASLWEEASGFIKIWIQEVEQNRYPNHDESY